MNKRTKTLLVMFALFVGLGIGVSAFFGIRAPRNVFAYIEMNSDCHPVWKEFALRHVHAGDAESGFLRRFPPSRSWKRGIDTYHEYYQRQGPNEIPFTCVTVVARGGHLVSSHAQSCTWWHTFFDSPGLVRMPLIGEDRRPER